MTEKTPYDEYAMTQQEVADAFGVSRPHIGSIEARAIKKIKKALEEQGITLNDLLWR